MSPLAEDASPRTADEPVVSPILDQATPPAAPTVAQEAAASGPAGTDIPPGPADASSPPAEPVAPPEPAPAPAAARVVPLTRLLQGQKPTSPDPAFEATVLMLENDIQTMIGSQQSDDKQDELARIVNLLPNVTILANSNRLQNLAFAVKAINVPQPNLTFASAVRSECELAVLRSQRGMFRFVYLLAGSTPISATLSGLIFSALGMLAVAACLVGIATFAKDVIGIASGLQIRWLVLCAMAVVAAMGSFVSILSRLSQVTSSHGYDAFLVFATGFFKPWIGVAFGGFLFFVLESHLINIASLSAGAGAAAGAGGPTSDVQMYCVLAFISGFSERLVSDFITRTGNTVLGAPAAATTGAKTDPAVR